MNKKEKEYYLNMFIEDCKMSYKIENVRWEGDKLLCTFYNNLFGKLDNVRVCISNTWFDSRFLFKYNCEVIDSVPMSECRLDERDIRASRIASRSNRKSKHITTIIENESIDRVNYLVKRLGTENIQLYAKIYSEIVDKVNKFFVDLYDFIENSDNNITEIDFKNYLKYKYKKDN